MIAPKWESNHKAAGVIALITLIVHIYVIMCFHDYPLIAQVDARLPACFDPAEFRAIPLWWKETVDRSGSELFG